MRSRTWTIVAAAAAGLALAGIAVADTTLSQTTASATGSAATVAELKTTTCTSSNVTFESTRGRYTGNVSGTALLTGPLQIKAHTLVNTGNGVGRLDGSFRVDTAGEGETKGRLRAVLVNGALSGWIEGRGPSGKLLGTFSGTWDKKSGFGSLSVGTGSASNVLVLTSGKCPGSHDDND